MAKEKKNTHLRVFLGGVGERRWILKGTEVGKKKMNGERDGKGGGGYEGKENMK